MSGGGKVSNRKANYYGRVIELLGKYSKILIVTADNVGSSHMQSIRKDLRGHGTLLMGKNTLIRKAIRKYAEDHKELEVLIPHVKGNCGLIFTNEELVKIRDLVQANKIGAFAKPGSVAPCQVIVPACNTGMDPGKTSFFQALSINTKINRGKVEIINDVKLLEPGDKVSQSQSVLLQMLNIKPFEYYLKGIMVYEGGSVFNPKILDLTDNDILARFSAGVSRVTALSLAAHHPTITTVPHSVRKGFDKVLALAIATKTKFKQSEEILNLLENPEALAAAKAKAAAAAASSAPAATTTTTAAPAKGGDDKDKKKKKGSDDDEDGGGGIGGLFGGGDDDDDDGGGGAMGGLFGGGDDEDD